MYDLRDTMNTSVQWRMIKSEWRSQFWVGVNWKNEDNIFIKHLFINYKFIVDESNDDRVGSIFISKNRLDYSAIKIVCVQNQSTICLFSVLWFSQHFLLCFTPFYDYFTQAFNSRSRDKCLHIFSHVLNVIFMRCNDEITNVICIKSTVFSKILNGRFNSITELRENISI